MTTAGTHRSRRKPAAPVATSATVRVAIYTRQSVERDDGPDFGSIEAQRDAGEHYVASQRSKGWITLPTRYDDLGWSGATSRRPAFGQLLSDVDAGRIDVIVVYKFDRFSRNFVDFIQLIERLEQQHIAVVSTTEAIDSSSDIGRLLLHVMASFSDYSRKQIAERVRDKVRASRKRGIWTGGRPLLGYDIVDKKLVVNDSEAATVRELFATYLERGSLLAVVDECRRRGITNKTFTNGRGQRVQGGPMAKTTLRSLLSNPLFVGRINADGEAVRGDQPAIIDEATWDAVQALLSEHGAPGRDRPRTAWTVPLQGLLKCGVCASSMTHATTSRGSRRWSSFVCVKAQKEGAAACPGSRAPAHQMLAAVIGRLRAIGRDPEIVARTIAACRAEVKTAASRDSEERHQLRADRERLMAERQALQHDPALAPRLAEVDTVLADIAASETDLDRLAPVPTVLHEDHLRAALAPFDGVFEAMLPAEQARLLALLIESVAYDAIKGEMEIAFRPNGIRALAHAEETP